MESAQRSRVPSSSPDSAVSSDGAAEDEVAGGSGGGGTNDDDEQRERVLREHRLAAHAEAATARYVGAPSRSTVAGGEKLFDPASQRIKDDVLRMVIQYLQNEGFVASVMTIQDEANVKTKEKLNRRAIFKRMRQSIVEGDWSEVEKLCSRSALKGYKSLLYAIYKQQYLELVDRQEYQKAFTLLSRRLKPLENMQATQHEFKDLCYLLTCKSIQDAPSCKDWEGVMASREKLIEQFHTVLFELEGEPAFPDARGVLPDAVPENRLTTLLQQAVAQQVHNNHYQYPQTSKPRVSTLLEDYQTFVVPNAVRRRFTGHTSAVKCVQFVGDHGGQLATGSSDNTVRLWDTESGQCLQVLEGHVSRVWDLASNQAGDLLASASVVCVFWSRNSGLNGRIQADSTVKLWRRHSATSIAMDPEDAAVAEGADAADGGGGGWALAQSWSDHRHDCYSVSFQPNGRHLASGGYDHTVRLYDVNRGGTAVKLFEGGHSALVSRVVFSPHGKLLISGSKDGTIRMWDVISIEEARRHGPGQGVCIHTLRKHLREVSSVDMNRTGTLLLSSSKDNSNRVWDLRMMRPHLHLALRGHRNSTKNFIRAGFGPSYAVGCAGRQQHGPSSTELIVGGSEDGRVHMWGLDGGECLSRLEGHTGTVFHTTWNRQRSLLASCSDDGSACTWWYDANLRARPQAAAAGGPR